MPSDELFGLIIKKNIGYFAIFALSGRFKEYQVLVLNQGTDALREITGKSKSQIYASITDNLNLGPMIVLFIIIWTVIGLLIYTFLDRYLKKIGEENEGWDDIIQVIYFMAFYYWAEANFFQDVENKFFSYLLSFCLTVLALIVLLILNRMINKYISKVKLKDEVE